MERPSTDAPIRDWADYLKDLLAQAKEAAGSNDDERLAAVLADLLAFSSNSPTAAVQLDRIASQAAVSFSEADLGARLDRISKRDADFEDIYAGITAATPIGPPAESGWCPPRAGNEIQILIDGKDAYGEVAAAFHSAKKFIYMTISYGAEDFVLVPETGETLFDILRSSRNEGVDVRMVVWQPPSPTADTIPDPCPPSAIPGVNDGPNSIQARWDVAKGYAGWYRSAHGSVEPVLLVFPAEWGCHHQKTYIMDDGDGGVVAFVGGINPVQSYWDTHGHDSLDVRRVAKGEDPLKGLEENPPLHDIFYKIRGPAVGDVIANFIERYNGASIRCANTLDAATPFTADQIPQLAGGIEVQVARTIAPNTYRTTQSGDRGIRELYLNALSGAGEGSLIYIEDQYFLDYDIISAIYEAAQRGSKIIALLTSRPDEETPRGQWELLAEDLSVLIAGFQQALELVGTHANVVLLTLGNSRPDPRTQGKIIYSETYIHSKTIAVVGPNGTIMTGGSANIAFTSMWFHSEMNIAITEAAQVKQWVAQLWSEHLQIPNQKALDLIERPGDAFAFFKEQANRNKAELENGSMPEGRVYDWHTTFPPRELDGINLSSLPGPKGL
jgi:phosphatidylserine/phosphatidylglycerophosphate/cardiolipin synthase-like enzyme